MRRSLHYFTVFEVSNGAPFQIFGGDTLWLLPSLAHRFGVRATESGFHSGVAFAPQKTNAAR